MLKTGTITVLPAFLACVAAGAAAYAQENEPVEIGVLAHYVSWHRQGSHAWDTSSILPYRRGPEAGEGYDANDLNIIREHNEEFIKYGITPLASWWGPDYFAGDPFFFAYLSVPSPVKMAVLYEVTGLLKEGPKGVYDFNDPANVTKFVADIEHLHAKFFTRYPERFVTIDGRPVVFIWLSGLFKGPFANAAAQVRDKIFLVGSEFSPYAPGNRNLERLPIYQGLDAISAYGIQYSDFHEGHLDKEYVGQLVSVALLWSEWLEVHSPGTSVIMPLSFSSNDTGVPGRDPTAQPLISTDAEARYAAGAYRKLIVDSYLSCRTNILPFVLFVSYNEHYEGSSLEAWFRNLNIPIPHEFDVGWTYLNVIRDVFSPPIVNAPIRCPQ